MKNNIKIVCAVLIVCFLSSLSIYSFVSGQLTDGTNQTACNYTYSEWSACQPNGIKVRFTRTYSPYGCTGVPELTATCEYSSTIASGTTETTPCTYIYSDWYACQSNGTRNRIVQYRTPESCTGTPEISGTCTYTPTTCIYNYSDWSTCGTDGKKTRTVTTYYPVGCNGTPELTSTCTASTPCIYTYSDWSTCGSTGKKTRTVTAYSSAGCTGTPETIADCTYASTSCNYTYSDWSICGIDGKKTRTVTSYPTVTNCVGNPELTSTCTYIAASCTYVYSDWSVCGTDGKKTRTIRSYPTVTNCVGSPELTATCDYAPTVTNTNCTYRFSDYGNCINGKKSRTVISRYPEECKENLTEPLEISCEVAVPETSCTYTYSDWSACENGKKIRKIISANPSNCTIPTTVITATCTTEETCTDDRWQCADWSACDTTGIQKRDCKIVFNCSSSVDRSPEKTRTCIYKTTITAQPVPTPVEIPIAPIKVELPQQCLQIGWDNESDCEIYLHKARIVSDCLSSNLNTRDQCRSYLIQKYGKPLKCEGLSEAVCINLINRVLLSDLQPSISPQAIKSLDEASGRTAVIDTKNNVIRVNASGSTASADIQVDSQPLANVSGNIQVNLLSITVDPQQQTLSPTAITFDSNGNGIPDDVESRIGNEPITDKVIASLTGVDKAIVTGQTLEQPKAIVATPSSSLIIDKVETVVATKTLKFEGKAKPGTVITLYIYSSMPIVVTVKTDANGNWVYDLDKSLVDGTHEVYVAVNDDTGKIIETSLPTPFFIEQAQAVSMDEFVKTGINLEISAPVPTQMVTFYMFLSIILVALLILLFLIVRQRLSSD